MTKTTLRFGAIMFALTISTTAANAAFISGSISFSDGFDTLPPVPTSSIVSGLTAFDIGNPILVNTPTGDFAGTASATGYDFDINALPTIFFDTDTSFSFFLTSATIGNTSPLSCVGVLCTDSIQIFVDGVVSATGFDDTAYLGVWTANGTCQGSGSACDSDVTASWSVSLTSTASPPAVPEPATTALFGFGLALAGGIGYKRRKTIKPV